MATPSVCHALHVSTSDEPRRRVRHGDVEVLTGIIAIVEGNLLGGHVDERTASKLASRFVEAGLLARESDGSAPSEGRVAAAMDQLIGRLRFALGESDFEPEPLPPEGTTHVLRFPSETQAANCKAELREGADEIRIVADPQHPGWQLLVAYSELVPDPGFISTERTLHATARRFGGFYSGSQTRQR